MAIAERRDGARRTAPPAVADASPRGFRPGSRRRARIAAGSALAAVAIGGNVLVYSSLNDETQVVQLVNNIAAGELITLDDLQVVEAGLDPSIPSVAAADIGLVVGQYARVYIPSGSLIVQEYVQPSPLVSPGMAVVAVGIASTDLPDGLRVRSHVQLVIAPDQSAERVVVDGRVVARSNEIDSATGMISLSVEVAESDGATLAAATRVSVVLLPPGVDPVLSPSVNVGG